MSSVSAARRAAFAILNATEKGHAHSDDLLRGRNVEALSQADRNLATALVLGVLRWQIDLDQRIRPLLKHPNAKLDVEVLIALRLGAFQLLHMDRIPARAAIDESVEMTKQAGHRFASGMVNAVLRRLSASRSEQAEQTPAEESRGSGHPPWMVERWIAAYGEEVAREICRHGQSQPNLTVRVIYPSGDPAIDRELAADGINLGPGRFLTAARTIISGDITTSAAFREGRVRIQDEGSQLVAELAPRGATILDCCAAPGGKTLILAERNPNARITACESSPQRLAQLRERLDVLGDRVECRLADATVLDNVSAYDVVLADVPCSGTGTLGRNPEIRHRLRLEDLPRQAERQRAILRAALRAARPGGHVIYSTCSLEPEENEHVVAAVLSEREGVRQVSLQSSLQSRIDELCAEGYLSATCAESLRGCITTEGSLRLMPGFLETDGFFVAMFEIGG